MEAYCDMMIFDEHKLEPFKREFITRLSSLLYNRLKALYDNSSLLLGTDYDKWMFTEYKNGNLSEEIYRSIAHGTLVGWLQDYFRYRKRNFVWNTI